MKSLLVCLLLVLTIAACNKDKTEKYSENDKNLIGKWKYIEQYMSPGGPGTWKAAEPAGQIIEFKKTREFIGSDKYLKEAYRFKFVDSARIKIYPVSNDSGFMIMGYTLSNENRELQLHPLAPYICIEGCSSKFVRE